MAEDTQTADDIDDRLAEDLRANAALLDARSGPLDGELLEAAGIMRDALNRRFEGRP